LTTEVPLRKEDKSNENCVGPAENHACWKCHRKLLLSPFLLSSILEESREISWVLPPGSSSNLE